LPTETSFLVYIGMSTVIPIASDHRGFKLKAKCIEWLAARGYAPKDLGTDSEVRCDASDLAEKLAREIGNAPVRFGVLICGTGQAMAMTANRFRNIRAALCTSMETVKAAREHNDANVLAIGADFTDEKTALQYIEAFLGTQTLGGRYAERRAKLDKLGGL
jgi:ribose 5-phosphate isomerase B